METDVEVVQVSETADLSRWMALLRGNGGSPLMSALFLQGVRTLEESMLFLEFYLGGELVGLISGLVMPFNSGPLSRRLSYLRCYCGPLALVSNEGVHSRMIEALAAYAKRRGYLYLDFLGYDDPMAPGRTPLPWPHQISEYRMQLDPEVDVLAACKPKVRQIYRKAARQGFKFEPYREPDRVQVLVDLLDCTRDKRQTRGVHAYDYYNLPGLEDGSIERLCANGLAEIYVTRVDGEPCVATFAMREGHRAIELLRGCNAKGYDSGANTFAAVSVLFLMRDLGCRSINTGGVSAGAGADGLHFFKQALGYSLTPSWGGRTEFLQGPVTRLLYAWGLKSGRHEVTR